MPHHNNNRNPLSAKGFIEELNFLKNNKKAPVFCTRQGAPDIFAALKQTDFVVLHVLKDLLSKRNAKDPTVVNHYSHWHSPISCEIESLTIVMFQSFDLSRLVKKRCPKRHNHRKSLANMAAALSETSALEPWLSYVQGSRL